MLWQYFSIFISSCMFSLYFSDSCFSYNDFLHNLQDENLNYNINDYDNEVLIN